MQRWDSARLLDELRARVARIEQCGAASCAGGVLAFGVPEIDGTLSGGGLARGTLLRCGNGADPAANDLSWYLHGLF